MDVDLIIPLAGMLTGIILGMPIIRAGVRFLERKTGGALEAGEATAIKEDLRLLHERLDAMETDSERLAELEERLDFAERVLAQHDRPKIEKPNISEVPT